MHGNTIEVTRLDQVVNMKILTRRKHSHRGTSWVLLGLLALSLVCLAGCSDKETEAPIPARVVETSTATAEPLAAPTSTPEPVFVEPTEASEPGEMFVEEETALGGGGRIIFSSEREEKYSYDLYTILPDGSEVTRITNTSEESEYDANWSPDGERIVFRSFSPARTDFLYIMNIDGSDKQLLLSSNRYAGSPDWSEAGIVYYEGRCTIESCWSDVDKMTTEIYVIQPDGSKRTALTFSSRWMRGPSWSPNFEKIVFTSGSPYTLQVMNADGSGQEGLIALPENAIDPAWSPDGEWIVFATNRHVKFDIYMVRPDGSDLTRLTDDPHNDEFPAWSPDSKFIVFSSERDSERDGDSEIYMLEIASGALTRLTDSPLNDVMPDWAP
jgi:TolB protein